ncbi:MAG: hypothetical protein J1F28_04410 [Oscillospiraceae bacterium]|nr:hypothetical protein [Oscillospiraceae bacterium]
MERENDFFQFYNNDLSVKHVLKFYADIDGHIAFARNALKNYEDRFYGLHSGGFGDAPSKTNKISNPTESAVLNIPDSASREMGRLRAEIERLYSLQTEIFAEICKLPLVEKNIIVDFYIKKRQWVQISSSVHYSETQCKKIRNRALKKLGDLLDQNELVKNFNYPF